MPLEEEVSEEVVASREKLYRQHIYAAHLFAERAQALELKKADEVSPEDQWRHRAYVTGTIFAATAFLESSINELYAELQNLGQSGSGRLPAREVSVLNRVWPDVAGSKVLHRYQVALSLADADAYDESQLPFSDADTLMRLREALLSSKSDWQDKKGRPHTLEKRLKGKFPLNALAATKSPLFPDRLLGAACALWAVRTVETFSDDFCHRMGIPARARTGREKV
jgi:hypothetical protein